jgi:hypothetical protein
VKERNIHQDLPQPLNGLAARVRRGTTSRQVLLRMGLVTLMGKLTAGDWSSAMNEITGPAVDPEAFRVEGHCCGIRLPVLKTLTGQGIRFELTPEAKAQLVAEGVLPDEDERATPRTS